MAEGDKYLLLPIGRTGRYYAIPIASPTEDEKVALLPLGNRLKYVAAIIGTPSEDDILPLVPLSNRQKYVALAVTAGVLPCCALVNAGFETGDMTGWDFFYANHNDGTVTVTGDYHHTGSYSMDVYINRTGAGIAEAAIRGTFVGACAWEADDLLRYWYRWPSPASYHRVNASLQYYDGTWHTYAYGTAANSISSDWVLYEWALPAMTHPELPQAIVLGAWFDTDLGSSGHCYMDDVEMVCA